MNAVIAPVSIQRNNVRLVKLSLVVLKKNHKNILNSSERCKANLICKI